LFFTNIARKLTKNTTNIEILPNQTSKTIETHAQTDAKMKKNIKKARVFASVALNLVFGRRGMLGDT